MSDKELIELLRRDPQKGFYTLATQYGGLLYTLVRGKLSAAHYGSAQVEDIVADTLSDFFLGVDTFDPQRCSIKSYLCVIVRRKAIDALRKSTVKQVPLEDAGDLLDVADTAEENELRADLLREIQSLGEPDSSILIRKYYLGQPSKEIAAALDLTPANVDTRAHRAIEKLRKIFSEPSPRGEGVAAD